MTRASHDAGRDALADASDARWAAVCARDRGADGSFVYSVETTGIYCRPSCPARRPRRAHVGFHGSPADAERAGFRPCRRCRPDGPSPAEADEALVARLCRRIEASDGPPSLTSLARHAGLSPTHTRRVFRRVTGLTPKAYAEARRAARAREGLAAGRSVTESFLDAGYGSSSRFYARSTARLGMTPRVYRAGAPGVSIRFAVGACSLGAVLVAATDRGVCAVALGDDPEALVHDLEQRFPRATLRGGDAAFETLVARVVALVEHPTVPSRLPLDVRGTAFQERVWAALTRSRPGETTTYRAVAEAVGQPTAARAVARACAANPVAVAIPCHRVVRTDGVLSGYLWGIDRKRALLDRERAAAAPLPRSRRTLTW